MTDKKKTNKNDTEELEKLVEEQEVEEAESDLDKELENLKNKVQEVEHQYKRALADYQNLEKRTREERSEWIRSGNKELLLRLLPVLDILMLAAKHINDKGLDLSIQQFLDVLSNEGVKKIETVGKEFNPHTMEGVEMVEGEDNKVIEEVRTGYMLHDKILRAAQVKVGKKS